MKEKEIPSLFMDVYNKKIYVIRELKEKIEVLANKIYNESIKLMDESGKFECVTRDFDDGFRKAFFSHNDIPHIPRGNRAYVIITKLPFNYLIEYHYFVYLFKIDCKFTTFYANKPPFYLKIFA